MRYRTVVDHGYTAYAGENDGDVRMNIANRMIDRDYPVAEIAQITGLSIDEIERLK
ncbi:MAG: hypothetical protein Q4C55_04950 [Eubacterium sp.]|nr:hypothetical protein [Eubacterium sp.]